jgi:prophage regulatory protein
MKTQRLIRFREVQEKVGLSRTTIWRAERDGKFPNRKQIGKNSIAWLETDIDAWIESKIVGLTPAVKNENETLEACNHNEAIGADELRSAENQVCK